MMLNQSHIDIFLILVAFFLGAIIVAFSIPPIVRIANAKNLIDELGYRKIHTKAVPSLGGVAIFIGVILSTIISTNGYSFDVLKYIIAAVIIMFFIGLKDDIMVISAYKKFTLQILASLILIFMGDIRITDYQGLFGINEVNYFFSTITSVFLIVVIINSFNFIDGVDGLASGLAIASSAVYGIWFYLSGNIEYSILCFALSGSLISFFYFNVFGKANKLFMGDSGSLIIGIILSVATIKFIELNNFKSDFSINAAPAVAFGILIVPLIDIFRLFFVRIFSGKSPFTPDTNHLHHCILRLNGIHLKTTLITITINIIFIVIAFGLSIAGFNVNLLLGILFILGLFIVTIPNFMLPQQKKTIYRYLYRRMRKVTSFFY